MTSHSRCPVLASIKSFFYFNDVTGRASNGLAFPLTNSSCRKLRRPVTKIMNFQVLRRLLTRVPEYNGVGFDLTGVPPVTRVPDDLHRVFCLAFRSSNLGARATASPSSF